MPLGRRRHLVETHLAEEARAWPKAIWVPLGKHARTSWIDMDEALMVIPATAYESNDVLVVPLVPAAYEILRAIPKPQKGDYLLSSTQGLVPMHGVSKYFNTRLPDAILAMTGTGDLQSVWVRERNAAGA
jgi:hypothetical protein